MIDWQTIDTVLLDMDGTLLDLHYDNHFWLTHLPARFAEKNNISFEDAHRQLYQHIKAIEGTLDWYCLDYWSENFGLNVPELKQETKHKIQQRPYVSEFLQALADNEEAIVAELIDCQGVPADLGGYYNAPADQIEAVMRPSDTLNQIIG